MVNGSSMEKTIVFVAPYEIGETISDLQKTIAKDATTIKGDFGLLVNDIAVDKKIIAYTRFGLKGITDFYLKRIENCSSSCVLDQLPKEKEIISKIDIGQYKLMLSCIKDRELLRKLKNKSFNLEQDLSFETKFKELIKESIVPVLVNYYLKKTNLQKVKIKLYFERQLRNNIGIKTNRRYSHKLKSWRKLKCFREVGNKRYLGTMAITNDKGVPVCRGIMLELYTLVAKEGYVKMVLLDLKNSKDALVKPQVLFDLFRKELCPDSNLKFETILY